MALFEIIGEELVERTYAAPAFVIEEKSGQKRRLTLTGGCLPLVGAGWRGRMRTVRSSYPGNPEATVQVLGPEEEPSSFSLRLDRAKMGGGTDARLIGGVPGVRLDEGLYVPLDLVEVLDSIRQSGQELEVTWSSFVRRGILESLETRPMHELFIDVTLTFQWHAVGDFVPATISEDFDFRNPAMTLRQLLAQFADLLAAPVRFAQEIMDELNAAVLQIESALTAYTSILDEVGDLADSGRDFINNIIGLAGTITEAAQTLAVRLEIDPGAASSSEDQGEIMLAAGVVNGGQDTARQMQEQAELIKREAMALFEGDDVLAVELAFDGATLQQYAQTYYGDASQWTQIAGYNQFSSPRLSAGEIVVIPRFDARAAR